jgi:hypothetical protein
MTKATHTIERRDGSKTTGTVIWTGGELAELPGAIVCNALDQEGQTVIGAALVAGLSVDRQTALDSFGAIVAPIVAKKTRKKGNDDAAKTE